jgi:hypothetical protein
MFTGCGYQYVTQYYVDGKRVNSSSYYNARFFVGNDMKVKSNKQWSNINKSGILRDYTEIIYE